MAGIHLINYFGIALYLIHLAGDIETNPVPESVQFRQFTKACGLKISHINIRSIVNKMDSLKLLLKDKPFDIITISETWLKPSIPDCEVTIPGYSCVRQDRMGGKNGGGTIIYVRDGIPYRLRTDLGSLSSESCVIEVTRLKCKKLFTWVVYKAPDIPHDTFTEDLRLRLH